MLHRNPVDLQKMRPRQLQATFALWIAYANVAVVDGEPDFLQPVGIRPLRNIGVDDGG